MPDIALGLEVHVQLDAAGKLFCGCEASLGAPPGMRTCPVCRGESDDLHLNDLAVDRAARSAMLLGCRIPPRSRFVRKWGDNPGFPRGYQLTQKEEPIALEGLWRGIRIERVQLEEDAGRPTSQGMDLNRCGVALAEIVTAPDFADGASARVFLEELRVLLRYSGVTRGRVEEGHMRCDINLSLRGEDGSLGPKVQIKGLAGFAQVEKAVEREAARQRECAARGEAPTLPEYPARFEPSGLPTVEMPQERVSEIAAALPEPYEHRLRRYQELGVADARIFARHRPAADYFDRALEAGAPPPVMSNLLRNAIFPLLPSQRQREEMDFSLPAREAARVCIRLAAGEIDFDAARRILAGQGELSAPVLSQGELEELAASVMAANPGAVQAYREGKRRALAALMGEALRSAPGASARQVQEALLRAIQ